MIAGVDPLDAAEAALAERVAAIERDDPLYAVAQAQMVAVRAYREAVGRAERIAARPARTITLEEDQLADLTAKVGIAAERGVGRYAHQIMTWRSVLMGGLGVGGLLVGIVATHVIDTRAADARMDAARIEVPAVFADLSAADAAAWARIIRSNPPPAAWASRQQAIATAEGKAAWVPLWLEPLPRPTPGTH